MLKEPAHHGSFARHRLPKSVFQCCFEGSNHILNHLDRPLGIAVALRLAGMAVLWYSDVRGRELRDLRLWIL